MMTQHKKECDDRLNAFLSTFVLPGTILNARVWGSNSHNTQVPGSDWDFSGVYAARPQALMGLNPPPETLQHDNDLKSPGECDYNFHEVAKWCRLLLKGNPGIIETLFSVVGDRTDALMEPLVDNVRLFVSQRVVKQYTGYAQGQIDKLRKGTYLHTKGGKPSEKWLYHIFRLLGDVRSLIDNRTLVVYKEDGPERDALMAIRQGGYDVEEMVTKACHEIAIVDSIDVSHLPESGDARMLEDWLVDARTKMFKNDIGVKW